jgi:hypothetical protein
MKAKEFLSALRTIIKEEVTTAVRNELRSVLTESKTTTTPTHVQQTRPVTKAKPRQITKDSVLNSLLVETTPFRGSESDAVGYEEWPTMDYGNLMSRTQSHGPINAAPDGMSIKQIEQIAPEVADALTKDYSQLMKAINKKKGSN